MANPQPTPFVRFSKELFEAFYLNPPETVAAGSLWLWVLRWTWADFEKTETPAKSVREIADELNLDKSTVHRELKSLVRSRRLKIGDQGGYAIQKDYDLWRKDGWKKPRTFARAAQISFDLGVESVPQVGTGLSHSMGQKRPTGGDKTVPQVGTPIRSKNIENREGALRAPKPPTFSQLPNNKNDTPRNRAELGHPDFPPEEHAEFKRLGFKIQEEMNDTWKTSRAEWAKTNACRRCRKNAKASATWNFCRPCSICSGCGAKADGGTKFTARGDTITCTKCAPVPETANK